MLVKVDKPRTAREVRWYNQGFSNGLAARTNEMKAVQTRLDEGWAEVRAVRAKLMGVQTIARALHDVVEAADVPTWRKY